MKDESHVPASELPAILQMENGAPVADAAQWRASRRAEIVRGFETHVYGATPRKRLEMRWEIVENGDFGPDATRRQIALYFGGKNPLRLDLLLVLPKKAAPCPIFLGLNFGGNHTITSDPEIALPQSWMSNKIELGVTQNRASEAGRGQMAHRWPLETVLARGYGVATAYYGDLDPDFDDGFQNGVHPLFYAPHQTRPAPDEWGAIGAWAWGLSRILDFLETDAEIDARRVALLGHSRLGKAALWAGAQDERFALVISNNSGCGGAALFRREVGETIENINSRFPHWFCANFHGFNGRERDLPLDQHQLLSLIAPRPLYVASAQDDGWADPRGEWLAVAGADPLYRFLGVEGHGAKQMPPLETPVLTRLGYHIRRGKHGVTAYDWTQFLDFADRH